MSIGYFVFSIFFIFFLSGLICCMKYILNNAKPSKNPKIQKIAEIAIKIEMAICAIMLAYVGFETIIILISPLFDQLNAAFKVAMSKIFAFFDQLIPYVVLSSIGLALWREMHPKQTPPPPPPPPTPPTEAEIEVAHIKAREDYPAMLRFMFRVTCATSQKSDIKLMSDPHDIECKPINGDHFYMLKDVPVYQFELITVNEVAPEMADPIRDTLQDVGEKYIGEYPSLISKDAEGRTPFEILTVHLLGKRVCVDVVLTTAASIKLIIDTRQAREERKMREQQERPNPYIDPDYGE